MPKLSRPAWTLLALAILTLLASRPASPQLQQSGGPGSTVTVTSITNALPAGSNVIGHVVNDASAAVIGHVIADSGSTTAVTGNVTVTQATGTNLHAVLDTTSTTAVTQATGTNLHAVIDTGSTTAVTGITSAQTITVVQPT